MDGSRRTWMWVGFAVAVLSAAGLGIHFAVVGLDKADKLASVIGAFLALAGLGLAAWGIVRPGAGQAPSPSPSGDDAPVAEPSQRAEASGRGRVYQAGRDQHIHER
ncbi:hypothetical protein [Streptomyces virginiae]|uniref:hypothetical protein n=1 Tax=Streptomyces virginiae TaxID=1961 RepID=UPI00363123D3